MNPPAKFLYDYYLKKNSDQKLGHICKKYSKLIAALTGYGYPIVKELKDKVIIESTSPINNTVYHIIPSFNKLIVEVNMTQEGYNESISNKWEFNEEKYTQEDIINVINKYVSDSFDKIHKSQQIEKAKNDLYYLSNLSKQLASNINENDIIIGGYGNFGLEITNPIPVDGLIGGMVYLDSLITVTEEKINYKRYGSDSAPNINGLIDVYHIYKGDIKITQLYLSIYNKKNSTLAPKGFKLININSL